MLDLTTLWAWWQKNKHGAGRLLLLVIIFAAGWQTGKVMSPYYAAHPIVFEDKPCAGQASSGGTAAELTTLQEEGREPAGKTDIGESQSAATPSEEAAVAKPAVAGASQKQFVGSVNSSLYHHKDCAAAGRIKKENQLWFSSTEEAKAAGYSPSQCTREKLGL